jgi:uncharacterized membrane protein
VAESLTELSKSTKRTKTIASMAIFSALYMVLRIIPTVPMIGGVGSFSLSDIIAPIYGIILGPYLGGFSIIIGSFAAMGIKAPIFLGLDFLPATINALALGFLVRRKWAPVVVLNTILLSIFILYPMSLFMMKISLGGLSFSFPFPWLHIAALLVLVSPLSIKAVSWVDSLKTSRLPWGIAILAFVGTMMQHLTGSLLFEVVFGKPIGGWTVDFFRNVIWPPVFFVYPWERLALIIFAVLVGTPLVRVLRKYYFNFGS